MRSLPLAIRLSSIVLLATLAGLSLSCGGAGGSKKSAENGPEVKTGAEAGPVWKPAGNEGSVAGKVSYDGKAQKGKPLSMDADSFCASKHASPVYPEVLVVNPNGTLKNVFVYVKTGLEGKNFAVPDTPVELDQDGCMYKPHVVGIQAGQNLKVVTSDKTTHNIHPMPTVNREWNVSQPPGADPIVKTFTRPEESIPVKCNQHPWMKAYIHVMSSPFYAISGDDGAFEIKGLPPGKYELEAIHETLGASSQQVTVEPNKPAAVTFEFKSAQAYRAPSLKMMPALVVPSGCSEE